MSAMNNQKLLPRTFTDADVKRNYALVSRFYDAWSRLTESKAAQIGLELAQIQDGEHILEVAVGTGLLFAEAVRQNPHGRSEGIDLSPHMLARAQAHLRDFPDDVYRLQPGSAYQLPFDDDSFNLIFNSFMFDLLPEADFTAVLTEFKRVLKPDGRAVIAIFGFGDKWYHHFWRGVAHYFPALLTGCRPIRLNNALIQAGFNIIETVHVSQNTFPATVIHATPGRSPKTFNFSEKLNV